MVSCINHKIMILISLTLFVHNIGYFLILAELLLQHSEAIAMEMPILLFVCNLLKPLLFRIIKLYVLSKLAKFVHGVISLALLVKGIE